MGLKGWCRPSGRSFGYAGTTPTARFRHSASISDTKSAAIHRSHVHPGGLHRRAFGLRIKIRCWSPFERAVAVSVASPSAVHRHRARSASAAAGVPQVGPSGCATSCAANAFMPLLQCSVSNLVRSNDDPAIDAANPAGASFSRKSSLASEAKAPIGRRMGTWPVRRLGGASGPVVICRQQGCCSADGLHRAIGAPIPPSD